MAAAAAQFRARGAALSMEGVAKAAGISRQALYLHFPSRTKLMLAVLDHIGEEVGGDRLFREADDAKGAEELLERKLRASVAFQARITDVVTALDVARHVDSAAAAAWEQRSQVRRKAIHGVVVKLARERRLAPSWTVAQVTDALWMLTAPRAHVDMVVGRGWSQAELTRLTLALAQTFLTPRSRRPRTRA